MQKVKRNFRKRENCYGVKFNNHFHLVATILWRNNGQSCLVWSWKTILAFILFQYFFTFLLAQTKSLLLVSLLLLFPFPSLPPPLLRSHRSVGGLCGWQCWSPSRTKCAPSHCDVHQEDVERSWSGRECSLGPGAFPISLKETQLPSSQLLAVLAKLWTSLGTLEQCFRGAPRFHVDEVSKRSCRSDTAAFLLGRCLSSEWRWLQRSHWLKTSDVIRWVRNGWLQ